MISGISWLNVRVPTSGTLVQVDIDHFQANFGPYPAILVENKVFLPNFNIQGVPEKSFSQRLLYISIVKKATKLIFIQLERWILPARFEYRTASERYLVTEICRSEVTEPRKRKNDFQEIYHKHFTAYMHVYNYYTKKCAHIFRKKSFG